MTRVLAALDESAAARAVLATAKTLGEHLGAEVEALHVLEDGAGTLPEKTHALAVPLRTVRGPVAAVIAESAAAPDVSIVVLGARGVPTGARPVGAIALELVTALRKPVVVVPPDVAHPGRLRRVLVPLDNTAATAAALRGTIEFARGCDLDLVVLHVHDEAALPPFEDQPQHETSTWAREFIARNCRHAPQELQLELRLGSPEDYVASVAADADVDLIALGWSQQIAPGRAAVVRETLARSTVPVLLVPLADRS